MKKDKKIYVKKALIVFPIILVLVGTILLGAFSPMLMSEGSVEQSNADAESQEELDLEDIINDDKALKIIDIHENLESYIDKEVVLEGYFIDFDEKSKVFGIEFPSSDSNINMASLSYKLNNNKMLEDISDTDLVKASGTITTFEELHEDDENGDHTHTLPQFNIDNIEIIR